jgi:hypothetical protein
MLKVMFFDISHAVAIRNRYFRRRVNAARVPGFTTLQKVIIVVHMLAYGGPADPLDEYICMDESIILECVRQFTRTMVQE